MIGTPRRTRHRPHSPAKKTLLIEALEARQLLAKGLGGLPEPAAGPSAAWVASLYTDALGREVSQAESQYWSQRMDAGVSRATVAQAVLNSREARGAVIAEYYDDYLGREVDVAGLDFWLGIWSATGGPDVVNAALIGSQEFYNAHGGTTQGAIQGLYNELLGRYAGEAEVDYWNNVIATTPLANVALGFIRSHEYRLGLTNGWYEDYLHRPVDAAAGNYWVWRMNTDMSQAQIQAALMGSSEYDSLPVFDVKNFGAIGNGLANDGPAIQAAFDAAKAAGGGKIVFGKAAVSYRMGTAVTLSYAQNIVIDATDAVFTEWTTGGVARLYSSFLIERSQNIVWKNGEVHGAEYQGQSLTHGGASTGYHAFMMANPDPTASSVPGFLRFYRVDDLNITGMSVRGRMRGVLIDESQGATVENYRFQGILNGKFKKGVDTNADARAESDVAKSNLGIVVRGGSNIRIEDARTVDDDWWIGSLVLTVGSVGLPQGVVIRDFSVGPFQDHALYLSSDYTTVEYGTIRGGPAVGGFAAVDFRFGSHNAIRGVQFTDIRVAIGLTSVNNEVDYVIEDCHVQGTTTGAVFKLPGSTLTGLVVRNCTIENHILSARAAIDLPDVQQATIVGNSIASAKYNSGIALYSSAGATSGHVVVGNHIANARQGVVARNVSHSIFIGNSGAALSGGTPLSALLRFENTTQSTVRGNVIHDAQGTAVYVPVGTTWSGNDVRDNLGLVNVNS